MNTFYYTVMLNNTLVAGSHILPEMVGVFRRLLETPDSPACELRLCRQIGPHAVPTTIVKRMVR